VSDILISSINLVWSQHLIELYVCTHLMISRVCVKKAVHLEIVIGLQICFRRVEIISRTGRSSDEFQGILVAINTRWSKKQ